MLISKWDLCITPSFKAQRLSRNWGTSTVRARSKEIITGRPFSWTQQGIATGQQRVVVTVYIRHGEDQIRKKKILAQGEEAVLILLIEE